MSIIFLIGFILCGLIGFVVSRHYLMGSVSTSVGKKVAGGVFSLALAGCAFCASSIIEIDNAKKEKAQQEMISRIVANELTRRGFVRNTK